MEVRTSEIQIRTGLVRCLYDKGVVEEKTIVAAGRGFAVEQRGRVLGFAAG